MTVYKIDASTKEINCATIVCIRAHSFGRYVFKCIHMKMVNI